ncbi:hypothetical protein [Mesorhizobium sp. KR9-304]|uniref:hypothetical protein n=1 Tax=Mesorhizobium sp. KR9-304 TaxID=3156614 RepID=UPI0032B5B0EB
MPAVDGHVPHVRYPSKQMHISITAALTAAAVVFAAMILLSSYRFAGTPKNLGEVRVN